MKQNFICRSYSATSSLTGATVHVLCSLENDGDFTFRPLNPSKPVTREMIPSISAVLFWPLLFFLKSIIFGISLIKGCIFSPHCLFLCKYLIIKNDILIKKKKLLLVWIGESFTKRLIQLLHTELYLYVFMLNFLCPIIALYWMKAWIRLLMSQVLCYAHSYMNYFIY